jgi:hypothetical protein
MQTTHATVTPTVVCVLPRTSLTHRWTGAYPPCVVVMAVPSSMRGVLCQEQCMMTVFRCLQVQGGHSSGHPLGARDTRVQALAAGLDGAWPAGTKTWRKQQ